MGFFSQVFMWLRPSFYSEESILFRNISQEPTELKKERESNYSVSLQTFNTTFLFFQIFKE